MMCFLAFINILTTVLSLIIEPFNYSPEDGSIFLLTATGVGIPAIAIAGILLNKYKKYKL